MEAAAKKPDVVDMSPAVASFMAVKDEEELVSYLSIVGAQGLNNVQKIMQAAANLTSTLLTHHVADKLETILDREAKITHEAFSTQIELRLGDGGDKGPDMRVWSKGRGLNDVSTKDLHHS